MLILLVPGRHPGLRLFIITPSINHLSPGQGIGERS